MNDPRKIDRADAIEVLWPKDGPYSTEQVISAAAAIEQLTRYLAAAVHFETTETLPRPVDSAMVIGHLRSVVDFLGNVLGQLYGRAIVLAENPALRHDRNQRRATATAADAGMALFGAMTHLPPVLLNLTRAAERLNRLSVARPDIEGADK